MTDTDIWFKTREMQQTDLGKQMKQLQTDIKQMSRWLVMLPDCKISLTMSMTIIITNNSVQPAMQANFEKRQGVWLSSNDVLP